MKESKVEKHLVDGVAELGGRAEKREIKGRVGEPDRQILWPEGGVYEDACIEFVETKRPDCKKNGAHERRQKRRQDELRAMGFRVYQLDSIQAVDIYLAKRRAQLASRAVEFCFEECNFCDDPRCDGVHGE